MKKKQIKIVSNHLKTVKGPNGNWIIDPEGNSFLKGRLCVEGWIDPKWLQLTNQGSSSGIPNNSLFTLNDVLSFKNSSGTSQTIGPDTAVPKVRANVDNSTQTLFTSTPNTIVSESISPSSVSSQILVIAGYVGIADNADFGTPRVRLKRGTTTIAEYAQDEIGVFGADRPYGGVITALDSPSTTGSTTYSLELFRDSSLAGTWTVENASIALIEAE